MNQDILLSKIVPNSTDTTWAQAYTTLNVYVTLSIESESSKTPVTTYGKELLEKLQREFFALDDKSLENIKKAVENVSSTIDPGYKYSILVGTIVNDILYIVIASVGQVLIKRHDKTGVIATGVENELHGFSGKLLHDDIVIFQSGDFAKKIPLSELSQHLTSTDVSQIAENITPLIHESSHGTESAIIIQYKDLTGSHNSRQDEFIAEPEQKPETEEASDTTDENKKIESPSTYADENLWTKTHENRGIEELAENDDSIVDDERESTAKQSRPFIAIPSLSFGNKKIIIISLITLLVVILAGSVFYQVSKKGEESKMAQYELQIKPIQDKIDEGTKLMSLNKSLALTELQNATKMIDEALLKVPKNSPEYKKLMDLKTQVDTKISEAGGGGSAKNSKVFLKAGRDIKSITAISTRGGKVVVLDSTGKQVITVTDSGKVDETYEIEESAKSLTSDDKFIYTLGNSITKIDTGNGKTEVIVEDAEGSSIQSFGSNVYTLTDDDVLKFRAPSYESSSYFTEEASFKSTPIDMGISGPVWVLESNGTIERFTKGANDNLDLKGLAGPIGASAKIYTDSELENIYVLDVKNQRVVVFTLEGEYVTQYEGTFMKDATSFAIDETNNTGYVVSANTVHSFDL